MNCVYCNGIIPRDAVTCPHCGAAVTKKEESKTFSEIGADIVDSVKNTVLNKLGGESSAFASSQRNENVSPKNRFIAGILGILFGIIGVHNFYVGRISRGIVQILLCWTGISWVWGVTEGLLCLLGRYKDADGKVLA